MANLQKVIKVTQAQYDTLAAGGTVGDYTGLNANYIYLIVDTNTYITSNGGIINGGSLTIDYASDIPLTIKYDNNEAYWVSIQPNPSDSSISYMIDVETDSPETNEVCLTLPASGGILATQSYVIPKSTLTTAGDIIYASAASTPARLGIGTNGQLLRVSSSGIPEWATVSIPAAQVQSDWNEADSTQVDYIKNKPNLATVATSGSYADLSNTPLSSISISQTVTPGTAAHAAKTTTTVTLDGTATDIVSYTTIDQALSSSSKNPVANNVIYNAISNKVDAEDFQELEQIALTTNGILTGEPLTPIATVIDGNYYPTVSDSGKRWKMGKADSPTFFKIYDVNGYTSVHLKSVSRAGHILTDTAPSDFVTKVHQLPTQVATWYEAASVSDSEQADVLPKTGYTPYDKDLTTNSRHYLIVYEVNAAQAIEVINGGGYSPIYTSMFTNDGDGTIQGDTYVLASELATVATSGSYNDLSNKPTIPTVSNETISIYNGEADLIDSFTLNQSISKNITLPYIPSQAADVNEYGQKYVNPKQVRQFQTIFGIAPTLLTNINGHDLSGVYKRYPASGTTTIGGYPAVKILNIDDTNLTFDASHNYMRKITGSEFTPTYGDGTVPQFSYIVDGQGNLYKPQWDSTNGLVLYVVNKLALASSIPTTYLKSASVSGGSLTLTNQNNGTTTFTPVVANPGTGSTILNTVTIGGTNYKLGGGDVDYDFDSTTGILTITVG